MDGGNLHFLEWSPEAQLYGVVNVQRRNEGKVTFFPFPLDDQPGLMIGGHRVRSKLQNLSATGDYPATLFKKISLRGDGR